ncbi:hypothetical protein ROHU_027241 [Labeo rohita]|uniref:Uncharacterized protein n=1 Tax=Labeo rohita TaxID=84645 RepID=A0A498LHW3_LABRO|nr:hypothetical protein ROHU_032854 [Labeo rohita]RXN16764.1 hypothetical protein ROHU_027241 [Labeo rohita]
MFWLRNSLRVCCDSEDTLSQLRAREIGAGFSALSLSLVKDPERLSLIIPSLKIVDKIERDHELTHNEQNPPGGSVRRYPPPRYRAQHGTCGITLVRSTQTCPHHHQHACIAVSVQRRLQWEGWWGRDPLRHHMKDRLGVPPYASQKDGGWIEGGKENRDERKVLMYCI